MKRYNIFYPVHKALRAMLYETSLMLQQTDFTSAEETETAINNLEMILTLFEKHAYTEGILVFTAIEQQEPALMKSFANEHAEDDLRGRRTGDLITLVLNAVANGKPVDGEKLIGAFIDFLVFNLRHMAREEELVNQALWKYYSDEQLIMLAQKIISSIPAGLMAGYSKWMIRGLSNTEIVGWLNEVKNMAPDFVFQSLLETAEAELSPQRWLLVQESLTEGALLA